MSKIKTKEILKGTIKSIDKSAIALEKTKDVIVNIKEKSENAYNSDSSINEYISDKTQFASNRAIDKSISTFNSKGKDSVIQTKENIKKAKQKVKVIKSKLTEKRKNSKVKKGIKTGKNIVKRAKKTTTQTVKATNRARKLAQETVKTTIKGIKIAFKVVVSTVKGVIVGTKALISALIAGGWVALIVIIVVCLLGVICNSVFGIFFSNEDVSNGTTMNNAVMTLNKEMSDKLLKIQNDNQHDELIINANRAEWKDVLALYAVKVSNGENATDVMTLTDDKINDLKKIYWDMNSVSYEVKQEINNDNLDENQKNILYINVNSKTLEYMMDLYNFNDYQKNQIEELLSEEYDKMWTSVIFGTSLGNPTVVEIALSQVGNVGGVPYWTWYGYTSRVEWCAIFVSWVMNEAGYIESGIIPKFSVCLTGVNWFKAIGQWHNKGYLPKEADIIFFDWENDGSVDHVGIVEKVDNNIIYTIEGNSSGDTCRQQRYSINSNLIYGFGTPVY